MSKKPANTPSLTTSRCKRIVRPLVSKIHTLTDMIAKYPSNLDFNFPYKHFEEQYRDSCVSTSHNRTHTRERRVSINRVSVSDSLDEYKAPKFDKNADVEFENPDKISLKRSASPSHPDSWTDKFRALIAPHDSTERLTSLKPFLSQELFEAYADILSIFKGIITTLTAPRNDGGPCVSSLSSLSASVLGKSIALSTKSTYYMTSRSSLFDPARLPANLRRFQDLLADDIDDWLEMKPTVVIQSYRGDLLIGYIVHLLVINSQQSLYLLVPVLVHWLNDEFETSRDFRFKSISRYLLSEFWNYGVSESDAKYQNEMTMALLGGKSRSYTLNLFWTLLDIGYWKEFVVSLGLQSNLDKFSNYDSLILGTLVINDKLNMTDLEGSLNCLGRIDQIVYPILKRNPQHPHSNAVFAGIITEILLTYKTNFKACSSPEATHKLCLEAYSHTVKFVRVWLSFPSMGSSNEMIFNSLYAGNEEIFCALSKFVAYTQSKIRRILQQTSKPVSSSSVIDISEGLWSSFDRLRVKLSSLLVTIALLKAYFLDLAEKIYFGIHDFWEIFDCFVLLQDKPKVQNYPNHDLNDFLLWLNDRQDPVLVKFAQLCFERAYGSGAWFEDPSIDDLYLILFSEVQGPPNSKCFEEVNVQSSRKKHKCINNSSDLLSSDSGSVDSEDEAPRRYLNRNRLKVDAGKFRCLDR